MAAEPSYKIFIRGIAPTVDENGLELAFSKYGRIMEVLLLRDKETKASRGLGFITFECTEDCEDAVRGMNGQELKGSILKVEIATEKRGYQTNPRGHGFVRGSRGGFPGRGVELGRFQGRGGRPFGHAAQNRDAPIRGRGAFRRGGGAFESQRERFPGPAEYDNGRESYPGLDVHHEYPPRMAPTAEPRDCRAPNVPRYSYPNRPEGSGGPEGDYEGRAANWSRSGNVGPQNPERGYPPNADLEYSRQDPGRAYDANYDSVDHRGYEAGYGLIDCRALDGGYPPPPREERPAYSYDTHADYRDYPNPDWNREYDVFDQAAPERRPRPGQGYGMVDPYCYESSESRSYGVKDAPGYRVAEPDRAHRIAAGGVQRSERGYLPPMDSYTTPERDYCSREWNPDNRGPDSWIGYDGASPVDPSEYGYGPVETVESRGTRDREHRPPGPIRRLERGEMDTRGTQRTGYGPAEPEIAHRSYPVMEEYRREAAGPDPRAYGCPDPLRYTDLEIQEDEFSYEDRKGHRNPRSRGYPDDTELGASGDYVYPDPALKRSQRRPYGAYESASAQSEGFSGGRPTRGLPRGSRGNDSGMRHPLQRPDAEEPEAKRRRVPETRGSYMASRGRMPLRGSGRRAGRR